MFGLTPATLITRIIVLLIAMGIHEFAHAYGAFLMGDTTAYDQGRMTPNPFANIYWPGFIIGVLVGFAVLGSAPVNPYRMRNPRWGMFVAVLAGPVSNLLLATICAFPFRFGLLPLPSFGGSSALDLLIPSFPNLMFSMIWLNVALFVFNILPFYPLDGWTVVLSALPPKPAITWQRYQQQSTYALFGLIALSFILPIIRLGAFDPLNLLIGKPTNSITLFLMGL